MRAVDPILGAVIKKVTLDKRKPGTDYFRSLAENIISQQLSGRVADVITGRFITLFAQGRIPKAFAVSDGGNRREIRDAKRNEPFPDPERILAFPDEELRKAGLSYQKISYIKNIAAAVKKGELDFQKLKVLDNEEAIEVLTRIKGVGRWTAEMFLMFTLEREDIFSHGDLGLKNAMQRLYGFQKHPSKKTAERISKKWSPYRTLACRYLWASLDVSLIERIKYRPVVEKNHIACYISISFLSGIKRRNQHELYGK